MIHFIKRAGHGVSLAILFLVFHSVIAQQQMSPPEVKNLLAQIHDRHATKPDMQADFREEKTIRLMTKPVVSSGKVWFERPNKFRREVKGKSSSTTVSNGQDLWIYYPTFKSAEHYKLGKRSPADAAIAAINAALNIEDVEKSYRVSASKIGTGYQLELQPRSPSMKRLFQKFDLHLNKDLIVEHTETLQPNGDRVVTNYTNQNQTSIPKSTFDFTPPPGTEVTNPLGR